MLIFIEEDDTETDANSGIHLKKAPPSKSSFIQIYSSRDQLQSDAKQLHSPFWHWRGLMDVNNRLSIPDVPSTEVHMV